MPIETAHEIAAALSDYVGDPTVMAPEDVPSMYADPATPASSGEPPDRTGDPDPAPGSTTDLAPPVDPAPPVPETATEDPEGPPHPEPTDAPATADEQAVPADDLAATQASAMPPAEEYWEPESWEAGAAEPAEPPPPFEPPPDRPLFADHERRVPPGAPPTPPPVTPAAGPETPDPAATGSEPRAGFWPFEDPQDTGSFSGREGRSWLQLAAIVALAVAVLAAMVLAFNLGRGGPSPAGTPTPTTTAPTTAPVTGSPIPIVAAGDFDPEGNPPTENPDEVPLAIDGKPGTGWRTLTYRGNPRLGGLKSGVGLVLDLGADHTVGSIDLRLVGSPTDVEFYATAPGVSDPPVELSNARRLGGLTADGATALFRVEPTVRTRFLIVWLTKLPKVSGGYRGEIAEVSVRS